MLVCHIAGCARVTGSATGIPTAGEAGCDTRCAALIADYLATVHRHLAQYAPAETQRPRADRPPRPARPGPVHRPRQRLHPARPDQPRLPHPRHPPRPRPDPRRLRPTRPRRARSRAVTCWDPHPQNPRSDHRVGRACDLFPTTAGTFPTGTDLANGWRLAAWLRAHAGDTPHPLPHLARPLSGAPTPATTNGWGVPYTGGGIYNPTDATGGHYDHIHLSVR